MKRIFYFTGHRLTVFHWSKNQFYGACSFEPDSVGVDKFKEYLDTTVKMPTKLLVDMIEEDFRKEVMPHVYGGDRKSVVGRMLDRFYRASQQYTYYEIVGREKKGRKDSEVLLGAITNPQMIQPWVGIIEDCKVPLSGIWTLPLVSKSLLPVLNAKTGPVLMVSQQVNSNLRQTFFRDGKMLSSRQSVINQDAADVSGIGNYAKPEVDRTIEFVRNQHLVEADEVIRVHVLSAEEQIKSLADNFKSDDLHEIHIHRVVDVHKKLGIPEFQSKFSDGIFAWLCMNSGELAGHYGEAKDFSRYYFSIGSKALYAVSVLVAVLGFMLTAGNISEAIEYNKSVDLLNQQAKEFKQVYTNKFEAYEPVFTHARSMNAAVDIVGRIRANSTVSPLDFYIEISRILSGSGLGKIYVDRIEWKSDKFEYDEEKQAIKITDASMTSEDPIHHIAVIKGRIPVSTDDYRGSVSRVNNIIAAIQKHPRVEHVEALDMPVEVRSEKKFAAESGFDSGNDKDNSRGVFSIQVVMRGLGHA